MKLIASISDKSLLGETHDFTGWNVRQAMRTVLMDKNGKVALMHIAAHSSYKLPGGGVDEGESHQEAFAREMLEETGYKVEIQKEIGIVIEKRDEWKMYQISHCFVAKTIKKVQEPKLTKEEKENDFKLIWSNGIDHAIQLISGNSKENYDLKYVAIRDLEILKKAKQLL